MTAQTAISGDTYWEQTRTSMLEADSDLLLKFHVPRSPLQPVLDLSLTGTSLDPESRIQGPRSARFDS